MMDSRFVALSFELWKQWMTQGFKASQIRCTKGLPADATLVDVVTRDRCVCDGPTWRFKPVLGFVFESAQWKDDGRAEFFFGDGTGIGRFTPEFETISDREAITVTLKDKSELRIIGVREDAMVTASEDFVMEPIVTRHRFPLEKLPREVQEWT